VEKKGKKPKIHALLVCVNFTDYLEITIPHNRVIFESITVITSTEDVKTQNFCKWNKLDFIVTDAFKPRFNKGAAINKGLSFLRAKQDVEWVMITDADIIWPPSLKHWLPTLHPSFLYGCCRRVLKKLDLGEPLAKNVVPEQLEQIDPLYLGGKFEDMATFEDIKRELRNRGTDYLREKTPYLRVETPEIFQARGWNSNVASTRENPLPLGYGQLWNIKEYKHKYPEDFDTAAGCDTYFFFFWPLEYRTFLEHFSVLHIGPRYIHWAGRNYRIM